MPKKETPSCCKLPKCKYNYISPPENSQECVTCPQLKDPNWKPIRERDYKVHLSDPYVPAVPLCCVKAGLAVTDKPEEVTCGNCLRMMKRRKRYEGNEQKIV